MPPSELVREVAEPGAVFWESVIHPDNVELLEGDPDKTRTLPADKRKLLQQRVNLIKAALNDYFHIAIKHFESRKKEINRGLKKLTPDDRRGAEAALAALDERIDRVRGQLYKVRRQRRNSVRITNPKDMRRALLLVHKIDARITEHYTALENEAIMKRLRDEMEMEVSFFWRQIQDRWTALGYREEYFVDGKRFLRRVSCEEAHCNEDEIQYKIYISHIALGGGTVHHMPDGVRAWDLVKQETLRELEAACEVPVTSPHIDEDAPFDKGAWIIVHRVGMRDGLFNYISLGTVLAKYNQALRPKFAVPIGVRAGRVIEYLRLTDVPHVIITGITGSGKTNLERVILSVLCQFYSPAEMRLVLVDLKEGGDLNSFAKVPHLVGNVIKDMTELALVISKLHALMRQRLKQLSDADVFDILAYNKKVPVDQRMERVIVMIDECGSINAAAESRSQRDAIWAHLKLIAMKARAVGIQLVMCTQQGGTEVIPKEIGNNISYSINGRQRTSSGAMQAMGNNRAKSLGDIPGRMDADTGKGIVRLQTPEATNDAIKLAIETAMNYPPRSFLLPGDIEEDTAEVSPIPDDILLVVQRQAVINAALKEFKGVMSARKLYHHYKKVTPERAIQALIDGIAQERTFEIDGQPYEVTKYGKGWQIVSIRENAEPQVSSVAVSETVSPVVLESVVSVVEETTV